MKVSVKVDRRNILVMARELQRYSPRPLEYIFRSEVGSIVKICALRAKIASKAAIKRRVVARAENNYKAENGGRVSTNITRDKGRVWFVPPGETPARGPGGTFHLVYEAGGAAAHHLPDPDWIAFLAAKGDSEGYIKAVVGIMLTRRGLMRQSWLQIADGLQVQLAALSPGGSLQEPIARAARGPRGRTFRNGTAVISGSGSRLMLTVRNESATAIRREGQRELDMATARRFKAFTFALDRGFLKDQKFRAQRWKGIFVTG